MVHSSVVHKLVNHKELYRNRLFFRLYRYVHPVGLVAFAVYYTISHKLFDVFLCHIIRAPIQFGIAGNVDRSMILQVFSEFDSAHLSCILVYYF